ncbi:hypothetical protein P0M11_01130 [Kaistella sp. PBT33-4]|uniref:hypothetical protein n=1 Tax=Kaistella sp. PBT33-4 TaxID=3032000 RepID=UPI0023D87069|nr:hypothetical protein [Kaistella sp. PBT33-4]MDF0718593.1 hypothetical protein [Kaistella sp. PBT33-4]
MTASISYTIFGTFGNPNGFTQSTSGPIQSIRKFDLNPTAIQLFESTVAMYALRKEMVGHDMVISLAKYSYAAERESSRGGTFVGASIVMSNGIVDAKTVLNVLDNLHSRLISNSNNVQNGIIQVSHSDHFQVYIQNNSALKLNPNAISDVDFTEKGKNVVVFTSLKNISEALNNAIDLLNDYDSIYFTDDQNVAFYVQRKGLFELIQEVGELKQFSAKLQLVEKRKLEKQQKSFAKVQRELDEINNVKNLHMQRYLETINRNKEIHQNNQKKITDSERNLKEYEASYNQHIAELKRLQLRLNGPALKLRELQQIENEIRKLHSDFDKRKASFNEPQQMESLAVNRSAPGVTRAPVPETTSYMAEGRERRGRGRLSPKIITAGVVLLLVLVTAATLYFLRDSTSKEHSPIIASEAEANQDTELDSTQAIQLSPESNGFLNEDELKMTIKKQFSDSPLPMSLDSVVSRIFKANPTDIGSPYFKKTKEYGEHLVQINPDNFKDRKLVRTDGLQIPIYKKESQQTGQEGNSATVQASPSNLGKDRENTKVLNNNESATPPSTVSTLSK